MYCAFGSQRNQKISTLSFPFIKFLFYWLMSLCIFKLICYPYSYNHFPGKIPESFVKIYGMIFFRNLFPLTFCKRSSKLIYQSITSKINFQVKCRSLCSSLYLLKLQYDFWDFFHRVMKRKEKTAFIYFEAFLTF